MPNPICSVCRNPARAELEFRLARNVPLRLLGKQHGLSKDALLKHRKAHMPPRLLARLKTRSLVPAEELESQRIEESQGLLGRLVWQRAKLYDLLENREALDDPRACVAIHKTLLDNFALTGKLLGEFVQHSSIVTANLVITPDYLQLRAGLLSALRKYPEARAAVLTVLREVDGTPTALEAAATTVVEPVDDPPPSDATAPPGDDSAATHTRTKARAETRSLPLFPEERE